MPCRRAISLALAAVKERAAKGDFGSPESPASELLKYVRGLVPCKKRGNVAKKPKRKLPGKTGTKYQPR